MFEIIFKIWYLIAILPFIIFLEADKMLAEFLKKSRIYYGWNLMHSFLVILVILFIIFWMAGYR